MDNTDRIKQMKQLINDALSPLALTIQDDSHLHVGHVGAAGGAGHFTVRIVAEAFEGKSMLARHRLVYNAVTSMMPDDIHALVIRAASPTEAENETAADK